MKGRTCPWGPLVAVPANGVVEGVPAELVPMHDPEARYPDARVHNGRVLLPGDSHPTKWAPGHCSCGTATFTHYDGLTYRLLQGQLGPHFLPPWRLWASHCQVAASSLSAPTFWERTVSLLRPPACVSGSASARCHQ